MKEDTLAAEITRLQKLLQDFNIAKGVGDSIKCIALAGKMETELKDLVDQHKALQKTIKTSSQTMREKSLLQGYFDAINNNKVGDPIYKENSDRSIRNAYYAAFNFVTASERNRLISVLNREARSNLGKMK